MYAAFFLDIQSAYDIMCMVVCGSYKLRDMGVKGRKWQKSRKCMSLLKVRYFLDGEKSDVFKIEQGMTQGCSLSPI